jgi:uncharacterized membrane protein
MAWIVLSQGVHVLPKNGVSTRLGWLWRRLKRRLWFRAGLLTLLAVTTALVAVLAAPFIPSDWPTKIGSDAVDSILEILASSLLAVTIFSLSTAVAAYGRAMRSVTPRATRLLVEDPRTQNALATFLGAFMFSLVGIIALGTGFYGRQGRVVLFAVTLAVIVLIVVTLLRWIDHLSKLGTVEEATGRVEDAAANALRDRLGSPCLGGRPLPLSAGSLASGARTVAAEHIGYVQHIDVGALSECAERCGGTIYVAALPGAFVDPSEPLLEAVGVDTAHDSALRAAFTVGDERSFDQDPRFGMAVLAEIASRALSPGINDAGTAIDVLGRAVRVLSVWTDGGDDAEQPAEASCPRVYVPPVRLGDLFDDVFTPIARDGAAYAEVQVRLQKALRALARIDRRFATEASRHAELALTRAEAGLALETERNRVRKLVAEIRAIARGTTGNARLAQI